MSKSDDYLWDRSGDADPEVARLEAMLSPLRHDAPLRLPPRRARPRWIAGGLAMAAAAAAVLVWQWPRADHTCEGSAGFQFTTRGGAVACNGTELARGALPVGGVLDTGAHEAELAIADIGIAQLAEGTRVRLDRTAATGHQLYLERGELHARVKAPPRLFEVATASAQVTDLGCEYRIAIDAAGAGHISVRTGKVELATPKGVVVAPAGTHTAIHPGRRPGLPVIDGASPELEAAVASYETGGAPEALLAAAADRDAITIVNLAVLDASPEVLARLAVLAPPPHGVTTDAAAHDPRLLARWRDAVVDLQITVDGLLDR